MVTEDVALGAIRKLRWCAARHDGMSVDLTPTECRAVLGAIERSDRVLTYLAVPYSHPDHEVRVARFIAANKAAGMLMSHGYVVFSPISHTHPIAEECELPKGWEFWQAFDRAYLAAAQLLVVLCIDGWRESVGVTAEIRIAREFGIPVLYMHAIDSAPVAFPPEVAA